LGRSKAGSKLDWVRVWRWLRPDRRRAGADFYSTENSEEPAGAVFSLEEEELALISQAPRFLGEKQETEFPTAPAMDRPGPSF
jgi:hypothetical protein